MLKTTAKLKNCILFTCVLSLLISCGTAEPEKPVVKIKDSVVAPSNSQFTDCVRSLAEAKQMDSILMQQNDVDPPSANKAIKAFTDYAYYCQNDSLSPVFLIKSAQVAVAINNHQQAKVVLDACIENYPKSEHRAAALFLLAQLYDEDTHLNNETEARRIYEQIIQEYPKSDWAISAKGAIKFLGKTDEEILKEFQRKK